MGSPDINALLEKYWEGTASLEEETALRQAFAEGRVPESAKPYAPLFAYRDQAVVLSSGEDFDLSFLPAQAMQSRPVARRMAWGRWGVGLAAGALLALLSITYQWPRTQSVAIAEEPGVEEAYAQTLAALRLVSDKLNTGQASILELSAFDRTQKQIWNEND